MSYLHYQARLEASAAKACRSHYLRAPWMMMRDIEQSLGENVPMTQAAPRLL